MAKPTRRVPYSRDLEHLLHPGRATDFFDPAFGDIPSDAALCSEMARLAYVRHEDAGGRARLEGFLARPGFSLEACFNAEGTQGFAASRGETTVIAFRGTEPDEPGDIRRDARFWPSPWRGRGQVHRGFSEALDAVHEEFAGAADVGGPLLLTGHSLGAALALLGAGLIPPDAQSRTAVYTFGCPRVGDADFGASVPAVSHARYAGACDLVSWVPPRQLVPYLHHGILHCIDRDGTPRAFSAGEDGHDEAQGLQTGCGALDWSLAELLVRRVLRRIPPDLLADHAPINYTSAVWGLR